MNKEEFISEVKKLGIDITDDIIDKLDIYCNFLLEYNEHTNLTAIREKNEVYLKHFYDSLTITKVIDLNNVESLLDIGTGAGFPGMILKMFYPHLKVTLVDSNNKKIKFLNELKNKINVNNIEVINTRIEAITKDRLNSYDVVTARAVTNMSILTELAMPLVKEGMYFIAMKGNNNEEIENSKYAIEVLNGIVEDIEEFDMYGNRTLIKVKKIKKTLEKDIRPYDKIIKKPLQKSNK